MLTVAGDVTDPQTAERIVGAAIDHFGRIDTLVNNAGIFVSKPFVDYCRGRLRGSAVREPGGLLPHLAAGRQADARAGVGPHRQHHGSARRAPQKAVPAALAAITKGGLNAVTRSLAIEFADRGVRVNAVAPGVIKTPMHAAETHEFLAGMHPLGRMGEIQEVVDAVLYLEAAAFVTGEVLHVDGGAHAGRW